MRNRTNSGSLKKALCAVGGLLLCNAIMLVFLSNFNMGTLLLMGIGGVVLMNGLFWHRPVAKGLMIANRLFFAALGLATGCSLFLLTYGSVNTVTYREQALIVLGCGIRGEEVSPSLQARLDVAVEYHRKNSDALLVVSGGQGPQETISEALAMERYLLAQGVPADRIIKEEQATSTYKNFVFSKQLLDALMDREGEVAFVTTNYHIYRASRLAKIAGFDSITHCQSPVQWYNVTTACLRECLAVVKLWVFRN